MSLESIIETMQSKLSMAKGFDARIKFDFGDDGIVFIDATQDPAVLSQEDEEADCVLSCSRETFESFLDGSGDPNIAFMMGKLKVQGSMGIAMKLNAILED